MVQLRWYGNILETTTTSSLVLSQCQLNPFAEVVRDLIFTPRPRREFLQVDAFAFIDILAHDPVGHLDHCKSGSPVDCKSTGLFEKYGLDVILVTIAAGNVILSALLTGGLHFVTGAGSQVVAAVAQGAPITIVSTNGGSLRR